MREVINLLITWGYGIAVIVLTGTGILFYRKKKGAVDKQVISRKKFLAKFFLLNKAELELFNRIREAAPKLICFAQVSMSQIFYLDPRNRDSFKKLGQVGRKSIDLGAVVD